MLVVYEMIRQSLLLRQTLLFLSTIPYNIGYVEIEHSIAKRPDVLSLSAQLHFVGIATCLSWLHLNFPHRSWWTMAWLPIHTTFKSTSLMTHAAILLRGVVGSRSVQTVWLCSIDWYIKIRRNTSHSYCEERVLLCNTPPIRMNIVSYCEGGSCYTTLHKMDLVSRGGLLISYMSSDIYILCLEYTVPEIVWWYHIQQVIMRCRQDSIHSNPNDISSSEGDRSIHLTCLIGCRMLKDTSSKMIYSLYLVEMTR